MLHDLHHVANGFGTDLRGEGEISAWELRRGVRATGLYVSAIVAGGAWMGFCLAPRRTLRAWRKAGFTPSLIGLDVPYESLLAMSIGELRALLDEGLTDLPRGRHAHAPPAYPEPAARKDQPVM